MSGDDMVRFGLRMHRDMRDMMIEQARRRRCSVRQLVERWTYRQELADQKKRLKQKEREQTASETPLGPRTPEQIAAVEEARRRYPADATVRAMTGLTVEDEDYTARWDFLE